MEKKYQICSKCIMDTTDPDIWFDREGVCSHCHNYEDFIHSMVYLKKKEPGQLERLTKIIKRKGKDKPYDCIIGVSGGVDSTYTAYVTKNLGLRPLAVHLDNGWDSEISVNNIKGVLKKLEIDLYTYVLDWSEFKELQLAFLKASTPEAEIPTDHAILALLYKIAAQQNVQYILCGHNTATEGGGVPAWSQGHGDWRYIKSINSIYNTKKLKTFPYYGPFKFIYYTLIRNIRWIQILDYLDYNKQKTLKILEEELGWRYYGAKHYESVYTRFVEGYLLPKKFGYDKRRTHLSSLIWSDQMKREEALKEIEKEDYPSELQQQDKEFVIKKLGITEKYFSEIMSSPVKSFWDYPSYKEIFYKHKLFIAMYHFLKRS